MTRYVPTPGTGRCPLCAQVDNEDHIAHPWTDKLIWLWKASAAWKIIITVVFVVVVLMLACVFGLVRETLVVAL